MKLTLEKRLDHGSKYSSESLPLRNRPSGKKIKVREAGLTFFLEYVFTRLFLHNRTLAIISMILTGIRCKHFYTEQSCLWLYLTARGTRYITRTHWYTMKLRHKATGKFTCRDWEHSLTLHLVQLVNLIHCVAPRN